MDPEQTYLRVHARLSGMLSQLLTPRIRMALEYFYLFVAVTLFCILVVMHTNFVQQPGCSGELAGIEFSEAQLVQIKIAGGGLWASNADKQNMVDLQKQGTYTDNSKIPDVSQDEFTVLTAKFWSNWIGSSARRSKLIFKSWKSGKEIVEPQFEKMVDAAIDNSAKDEIGIIDEIERGTGILHPSRENTAGWKEIFNVSMCLHMLSWEPLKSSIVQWLDKRSKAFEPTYLYSVEKGYFLLPEGAKSQHNIQTVNVTIYAQNSCFGNRWQRILINSVVGYDTILMNSLLSFGQGGILYMFGALTVTSWYIKALECATKWCRLSLLILLLCLVLSYLYNFQTKEIYDLGYGHEPSGGAARFGDYFVTKCGVLIMSMFVFFTTTMSVSFTLRETQSRMLKFTVQLQHHARHHLPTVQLIFVHVIESLVFVPIMIGILFFLFEFYDDQLLAFLVLTLVWLCELFTMISVRTSISMQFYPRFFLLYFLVFHIYFFSYSYGFSYLAFSTTAAFMQHLILYFWNRFEVPALQRFMRSRSQLQQQGVQITSSTIYTSTVHIARVNTSNTGDVHNELQAESPDSGSSAESATTQGQIRGNNPDSISNSNLNPQQRGAVSSSSLLNPFCSLLLWILGGTSPDAIISFFSTFRDARDQGQTYTEPPQNENESAT